MARLAHVLRTMAAGCGAILMLTGCGGETATQTDLSKTDTSKPIFDVIVSNPPYIVEGDWHMAALAHEPKQALTSGADGLDDIRQIIAQAPDFLTSGGWLLLEHGYDQSAAVRDLLAQRGFKQVQSRQDLAGIERCSGGQWL